MSSRRDICFFATFLLIAAVVTVVVSFVPYMIPEGRSKSRAPDARRFNSVTATPPAVNATRLPVYSGYVAINETNGENLSLPYQGIAGSLHDTPVLKENLSFTIPQVHDIHDHDDNVNFPQAAAILSFGTPLVHVEAIKVDFDHATLLNSTENLGDILGSPQRWVSRLIHIQCWDGGPANGSFVPEGKYRLAIQALHMFGDEKNETVYDMVYTKDFNLEYS
ncbi:subtilase [Apiospora sp. TS-2023a]